MKRKCSMCHEAKDESEFRKIKCRDTYNCYCNDCQRIYHREYMRIWRERRKMIKNYFNTNLKYLIKANGLMSKEVAEEICVSDRTISSWTTGRTQPSMEILIELSYFLGVSIDDLLKKDLRQKRK